jgi:hypothetical protein
MGSSSWRQEDSGMRARTVVVATLAVALLGGCVVQSLHPFHTPEAVAEVPEILGIWLPVDDEEEKRLGNPWIISKEAVQTTDDDGRPGKLDVTWFKAGESLFVDATAGDPDDHGVSEWWAVHVAPVHTVCKVVLEGDILTFRPLRYDWLRKAVQEKKVTLPHVQLERDGEHVLFTATSKEWMAFLKEHGDDEEAFTPQDSLVFQRLVVPDEEK